jgi:hypothetical protein
VRFRKTSDGNAPRPRTGAARSPGARLALRVARSRWPVSVVSRPLSGSATGCVRMEMRAAREAPYFSPLFRRPRRSTP